MTDAQETGRENAGPRGIVDKQRMDHAIAALSAMPRPPEFGRVPLDAAKANVITGKETVHRFASVGDAVPPQAIVKGTGFAIQHASVWLVFWGAEWTNPNPPTDPNAIVSAVKTITSSDYVTYLREYSVLGITWGGEYFDSSNAPASFNDATIQNKVASLITAGNLPHPNTGNDYDTFYCVMMPSTSSYGPGGASGAHSAGSWTDPADKHTYNPFVAWIGNGTLDTMTAVFSHELVEAVTDPQGSWIQVAPANPTSWNEVCDVCASVAYLDGVAVSSYWSSLEGACVIPINQFNSLFQYPPKGASLQVIAIQKAYSTEVGHEWIYAVRAKDVATGIEYDLYRGQAASLIDTGANTMFVLGSDGSRSNVVTGSVNDHSYITTIADGSMADNLLSLPEFG